MALEGGDGLPALRGDLSVHRLHVHLAAGSVTAYNTTGHDTPSPSPKKTNKQKKPATDTERGCCRAMTSKTTIHNASLGVKTLSCIFREIKVYLCVL